MSKYTRPVTKVLRYVTRPARDGLRKQLFGKHIQRTVPLREEDRAERRRRWHVLVDLIHEHCPRDAVVIAEVGCRQGVTAEHVLKYCPQVEVIKAIDLQDVRLDHVRGRERLDFIQDDSVRAAATFADESFDLVFIDADHSEAAVRRDIAAWLPKIRMGGVISGHDYGGDRHPGVERAVNDLFARHRHKLELEADRVWWTIR